MIDGMASFIEEIKRAINFVNSNVNPLNFYNIKEHD